MMKKPTLSIIIPCFNAEKFIRGCLESILHSDFQDFEIIVADDGSIDQTPKILQKYKDFPQIKVIYQEKNQGPAKARNLGAKKALGEYLFFLDVDTEIEGGCLEVVVKKFGKNPKIGVIQAQLLLSNLNDLGDLKTETTGHFLTFFGFPYEVDAGDKETVIFGARSAAMAIRKNLFDKIGGFDEDYFIYGEDTDLSWRIWLAGYEVHFLPQAKVYHLGKSSLTKETNYRVFYEGAKNNTQNILKNAPLGMLVWMLPLHILAWMLLSLNLIAQGCPYSALWIYRGLLNNLSNLSNLVNKRKQIAKYRKPNPNLPKIIFGPLGPKTLFFKGLRWLRNV